MSSTVNRRAAALQAVLGAAGAVVPDPSATARRTAARTVSAAPLPSPVPPREEAVTVTTAQAPSARVVNASYRPRPAVAGWTPSPLGARPSRTAAVRSAQPAASDAALHLARRASWGATPSLVAEIQGMGTSAWLDAQLAPAGLADPVVDGLLRDLFPRLSLETWQVRDRYWPNSTGDLGTDVVEAYVGRALWSTRQLLEVMVDFWTNHLVVTAPWGETWDCVHRYHEDVIRRYALGRYSDMLVAAAMHPAMLAQLDNESSTKRAPNENFGREVLELHTVGVDGGYAESDIRTSALALTGISTEDESGEYLYRHIRHHVGPLAILGWSSSNASARGEAVGVAYLRHLAQHPSTARRIATKLAVRFVSDTPPSTLVDTLARVYQANGTLIAPVLRALFTSPEFAASTGQKTKRPLEKIVSTSRALGVTPGTDTRAWLSELVWNSRVAGQAPLGWPAPNGYPDVAGAWAGAGATLACWNWTMGQGWTASAVPQTRVAYPALRTLLPATLPATHGGLVDALATRLLLTPLPAAKRDAVCAFLDKTASSPLKATDAAVGWRLPYVVALVLDTPEFATR